MLRSLHSILNILFTVLYIALFIIALWVGVAKINQGEILFSSAQIFFFSAFFLIATLCSAVFHFDTHNRPVNSRTNLFLVATSCTALSAFWLGWVYCVTCQSAICVSVIKPLALTLSLWMVSFTLGVIVFFKMTNIGTARVVAAVFSAGALVYSYFNSKEAISYWAIPFVLAILGVLLVLFIPYLYEGQKKHHRRT